MSEKRLYGQFFTIANPFLNEAFLSWIENIPDIEHKKLIEPFAGSNNIVELVQQLNPRGQSIYNNWSCFDISPSTLNCVPEYPIQQLDTITNFPNGYDIAITNPPYLAKNSATRRNLTYIGEPYDDLYKKALSVMLKHCNYVAAIIPESFITSNLFHDRLEKVVSLTCKMFDDTNCPVCLAMFSPVEETIPNDFIIYRNNRRLGTYQELKNYLFTNTYKKEIWKMNDKKGSIGVCCVDNCREASIYFMPGENINEKDIKISSRAYTRISGLPNKIDKEVFIQKCNEKLLNYRTLTQDVFLTSFKGLRKDGCYRRRIDFKTIKSIMSEVLEEMEKN